MPTVLFDAYGTLFDLETALAPANALLGDRAGVVFDRWRTLQLEYAWLSVLRGKRLPFDTCTKTAFLDALASEGIENDALVAALEEGFRTVSAYSDAIACLQVFQAAGWRTGILSNGELRSLKQAVDAAQFGDHLDAVLSVTQSGSYKPDPASYDVGTEFSDSSKSKTLFVSSNWWDVVGARGYGLRVGLILRSGKFWPASEPRPALAAHDLVELASAAVS
ncbi:haloacid dehalogenase type II [Ruegeria sp. MALMAid1280]|uniref:haloacid dehalogenase type II n=1 Tax=Ruegeria sp. MALMAid1280 TaxID=3411634 RepID=UPI003BA12053